MLAVFHDFVLTERPEETERALKPSTSDSA